MRKIKFVMNLCGTITVWMMLAVLLFVKVLNKTEVIEADILWQILLVAFLCAATTLIYPWDKQMKRKELGLRIFLQYLAINLIVLGLGGSFCWYQVSKAGSTAAMVIAVGVIFAAVSAVTWRKSSKEAEALNRKLEEYRRAGKEQM